MTMTEAAAAQARHTRGIVLLMVVVLALVMVWPQIALWLPGTMLDRR
jgi:hypothetical protein